MPIGFGTESQAMGGADLAVTRDTAALNVNPAGLTRIEGARADLHGAVALAQTVGHRDMFGNDVEVTNDVLFLGDWGYAARVNGRDLWWGVGMFFQNGAGAEYPSMDTAFGTTDQLTSLFGTVRLNLGLAKRVNERWSVGVSGGPSYSKIDQKVFPDTSDPAPFFGYDMRDMWGVSAGGRIGVTYAPSPRHTFAAAYATPITITMKHGKLVSNQSAAALGYVTYRDVKASGIDQPQTVELGYAHRPNTRLTLAADLTWIDWSSALDRATLSVASPDNPLAPPSFVFSADHQWRDQYVVALGMAFQAKPVLRLMAGYNYGRNPIPDRNLSPLLAGIVRHHLAAGAAWTPNPRWEVQSGVLFNLHNSVTYTNPQLPFGPGATERQGHVEIHATLARNW